MVKKMLEEDLRVTIPEEGQFYSKPQYMVVQDNQDYTSAVPASN